MSQDFIKLINVDTCINFRFIPKFNQGDIIDTKKVFYTYFPTSKFFSGKETTLMITYTFNVSINIAHEWIDAQFCSLDNIHK